MSALTSEFSLETQALAAGVAVQEGQDECRGGGWGKQASERRQSGTLRWTGTVMVILMMYVVLP